VRAIKESSRAALKTFGRLRHEMIDADGMLSCSHRMDRNKIFVPVSLTLTQRIIARLDAVAKREDRSRSAMARLILSEGLTQRGPANFAHEPDQEQKND